MSNKRKSRGPSGKSAVIRQANNKDKRQHIYLKFRVAETVSDWALLTVLAFVLVTFAVEFWRHPDTKDTALLVIESSTIHIFFPYALICMVTRNLKGIWAGFIAIASIAILEDSAPIHLVFDIIYVHPGMYVLILLTVVTAMTGVIIILNRKQPIRLELPIENLTKKHVPHFVWGFVVHCSAWATLWFWGSTFPNATYAIGVAFSISGMLICYVIISLIIWYGRIMWKLHQLGNL